MVPPYQSGVQKSKIKFDEIFTDSCSGLLKTIIKSTGLAFSLSAFRGQPKSHLFLDTYPPYIYQFGIWYEILQFVDSHLSRVNWSCCCSLH